MIDNAHEMIQPIRDQQVVVGSSCRAERMNYLDEYLASENTMTRNARPPWRTTSNTSKRVPTDSRAGFPLVINLHPTDTALVRSSSMPTPCWIRLTVGVTGGDSSSLLDTGVVGNHDQPQAAEKAGVTRRQTRNMADRRQRYKEDMWVWRTP